MDLVQRLEEINAMIEEAISYENWDDVETAREELMFLINDCSNPSFSDYEF